MRNITCPLCRFRHAPDVTCERAKQAADKAQQWRALEAERETRAETWRDMYQQRPQLQQFDERLKGAKPCPFCAAPEAFLHLTSHAVQVECGHCGAEGPALKGQHYSTDAYARGIEARRLWDQRYEEQGQ